MSAVLDKTRALKSHCLMTHDKWKIKKRALNINPDLDLPPAVSKPHRQDREPISRV